MHTTCVYIPELFSVLTFFTNVLQQFEREIGRRNLFHSRASAKCLIIII